MRCTTRDHWQSVYEPYGVQFVALPKSSDFPDDDLYGENAPGFLLFSDNQGLGAYNLVYQLPLSPYANATNASAVGPLSYSTLLTSIIQDPFELCVDDSTRTLFVASHMDQTIYSVGLQEDTSSGLFIAQPPQPFYQFLDEGHPVGVACLGGSNLSLAIYGPPGGSYFGPGNISLLSTVGNNQMLSAVEEGVNKPNAVCADTVNQLIFYVVDNNGGGLYCVAYGTVAQCPGQGGLVAQFDYPAYCDVDTSTNTVAVALAGGTVVAVKYSTNGSSDVAINELYATGDPTQSTACLASTFMCLRPGVTCTK